MTRSTLLTAVPQAKLSYSKAVFFQNIREGVYRDIQRQEERKIDNLNRLQEQKELTKILKRQRDEDYRYRIEVYEILCS